jgi:hypothetical protein
MKKLKLIAFVLSLALAAGAARAQDSALLDLLVKKKVITDQEAEETRSELAKEYASTSAGKVNLSAPVTQVKLYGDVRARYEYRQGQSAANLSYANADRFRYRLRIGMDVTVLDDWMLGVRIETGSGARSTNVTTSNGVANGAPFGKAGSGIFVGQAYLKYTPHEIAGLVIEGGKIPNPFVTTGMVWDPDINPEGMAEHYKYTFGPFGGTADTASADGKGGKSTVTPGEPGHMTLDVFANFGQFLYDTQSPQNAFGASSKNDTWLFGYQVGAKLNFNTNLYVQFAPAFYNYSGRNNPDFTNVYKGDAGAAGTNAQTGINDLSFIDIPAEFGWTAFDIPFTIFGDFAYNIDYEDREKAAGHAANSDSDDAMAWQAGLSINKVKKKGDWSLAAFWQRSGQFSLDPNLIDDDVFDAHLNMQGIVLKASYALTDSVTLALSYNHGERINKALGTGGSGGTLSTNAGGAGNPSLKSYNLIQLDCNIKF